MSVGIEPGDHVAVHAMNCIEWVESFYGVTKARAVPINVNYRYVHHELEHIYDNSGAVMAIVAPEYVAGRQEVQAAVPTLKQHAGARGGLRRRAGVGRRRSGGSRAGRPTTATSSTRAARPASPRA